MRFFILKFSISLLYFIANLFLALTIADIFLEMEPLDIILSYSWMILIYFVFYFHQKLMTTRIVTVNAVTLSLKANLLALIMTLTVLAIAKMTDSISMTTVFVFYILNNLNPLWAYYLKKLFFRFAYFREPIFIICDDQGEENKLAWFNQGNPFGYDVKKIVNVTNVSNDEVNTLIDQIIETREFNSVVIDLESNELFDLNMMVNHIQRHVRKVIVLPKMTKLSVINGVLISSIHHKGMAFYIKNNLLSPMDQMIKRGFDLLVSFFGLILLSPLLIWLYSIVYKATRGHPFFSHERIGFGGRKFKVYKFRTMYLDADERLELLLESSVESKEEWEKDFKLKNDPRVTKIGAFLRKTSLDELPQLINVLKGEMSLVGPRPIIEAEVEKYGEYFEYFTAVRPGITGLWQVSGRNDIEYDERVQLDVWYVRNWSIELDIQILIKTVLVVLGRKGSY